MAESNVTSVPGVYEDVVTVQCAVGHVAYDNSVSVYVTECTSSTTWNDTTPCERKLFLFLFYGFFLTGFIVLFVVG